MSESINLNVFDEYKEKMYESMRGILPIHSRDELEDAMDYSITKRAYLYPIKYENSYLERITEADSFKLLDFMNEKKPILTASGVMFMPHNTSINPLANVIQGFMDKRKHDKAMMFSFPKGSEEFEKYNLLQQLDKIDANGVYGIMGTPSALVFNYNVAMSITGMGRTLVSAMAMFFESFLADTVKFSDVDEALSFISNIVYTDRAKRKYADANVLDNQIDYTQCFCKIMCECGFRWVPTEDEMDIIWKTVHNLSQEDLNRVYYKNNLYEFVLHSPLARSIIVSILTKLKRPYLEPVNPPEEIIDDLEELTSLIGEYVYYDHMVIDRIDKFDNMTRGVVMISDTDSTIVSLDAWYRMILKITDGMSFNIKFPIRDPFIKIERDEYGDYDLDDEVTRKALTPYHFIEDEMDFDFYTGELITLPRAKRPYTKFEKDAFRHSILNILAFMLDRFVNDYMEKVCRATNSLNDGNRHCKIMAKNEFTFRRLLMTTVKKNYASLQEVQEGHLVPEHERLKITGIASMAKSSVAASTRKELIKILYNDILNSKGIDQLTIIKHIAVLEKKILNSIYNKSKEFYKPLTIKSISAYKDPMSQQGIKASVVWNALKDPSDEAISFDERNAISVAKIVLNDKTVNKLKETFPDVYERAKTLLQDTSFKGEIKSVAIPLDVDVPDWLLELVDSTTIVNDNIGGFIYDSLNIKRYGKDTVNYSNIIEL